MADTTAARREARRKKILGNSFNRLQFISGKISDNSDKESFRPSISEEIYETQCYEPLTFTRIDNGAVISEQADTTITTTYNSYDIRDTQIVNPTETQPIVAPPSSDSPPTFWQICVTNKYDIVLISLFLQLLYSVCSITIDSGYIFLPLAVYVATKTLFSPSQPQSQMANVLLMLNGIPPHKVQKAIFIVQLIGTIAQDVCIFLFCTICVQSLLVTLIEKFVT